MITLLCTSDDIILTYEYYVCVQIMPPKVAELRRRGSGVMGYDVAFAEVTGSIVVGEMQEIK
jgi:hypothetical protein